MEEVFIINHNDLNSVKNIKREANIYLASLHTNNTEEYVKKKELFSGIIDCVKTIALTTKGGPDETFLIKTLYKFYNDKILSALTLNHDEFIKDNIKGRFINKRYPHIYKYEKETNIIYNNNAFNCVVNKVYDHNLNKQIQANEELIKGNNRVYIHKGGVVTGSYIEQCIIPQNSIDKHCFTIQSIINIPVSAIYYDSEPIFVVDHREPKLKALEDFYNVPISFDEVVASKKFNIRKYKKIK